jgi:hypothetical protein
LKPLLSRHLYRKITLALFFAAGFCLSQSGLAADGLESTALVQEATPPPQYRYSFGIGYPDLRVRMHAWGPLDAEIKFAFGDGVQAYSARAYVNAYKSLNIQFYAGLEGGYLNFNGVESLDGNGVFFQGFAGVQYDFAERWGMSLDIGPAYINVNSLGTSVGGLEWIYTNALYFRIF